MSDSDSLGRIYIRLSNNKLVRIVSMKLGNKGDIYIAIVNGNYPGSRNIGNSKFSYHPDGKAHMTSELPQSLKSALEFAKQEHGELFYEMLKKTGMGFKHGKSYSQDFGVNVPLDKINKVTYTRYGISLNDINTLNDKSNMLLEAMSTKGSDCAIIDAYNYKHLTLRFYLVPDNMLDRCLSRATKMNVWVQSFKHPTYNLHILCVAQDEWLGDQHNVTASKSKTPKKIPAQ